MEEKPDFAVGPHLAEAYSHWDHIAMSLCVRRWLRRTTACSGMPQRLPDRARERFGRAATHYASYWHHRREAWPGAEIWRPSKRDRHQGHRRSKMPGPSPG